MHTLQLTYIEGNKNGNAAAKEVAADHNVHFTGFSNGVWRIGEVNSTLVEALMYEIRQKVDQPFEMTQKVETYISGGRDVYQAALLVAGALEITLWNNPDGNWRIGPIKSSSSVEPIMNAIQHTQKKLTAS